jgi:hypothetical protein
VICQHWKEKEDDLLQRFYIFFVGLVLYQVVNQLLFPLKAGVCVSQLSAKSLDLMLSGQQMSAQLHCHILVVYHLHSGNIPFQPVGLELILLPVG